MRSIIAVALLAQVACSTGAGTSGVDAAVKVWALDVIPVDRPPPIDLFDIDGRVPRCPVLNVAECACGGGERGIQVCQDDERWGSCDCRSRPVATNLPPRLLWPPTAHTVTSQRPTLRWVLPNGITRARVELCDDRACTRRLRQTELLGTSWRSTEVLRPGVVFWRVLGLDAGGSTTWTSATWSFGVRRRDTPTDTVLGKYKDLNGDGYDDLLVAVYASGAAFAERLVLQAYLGSATGLAATPLPPIAWSGTRTPNYGSASIVTGDVNGDGLADVLATFGEDVGVRRLPRLFYGRRDGTLSTPDPHIGLTDESVGPGAALALLDFNGDGFDDIAVVDIHPSQLRVEVHLGGANGASSKPSLLRSRPPRSPVPGYAAGADVNQDGYADLTLWVPDSLTTLVGNPDGVIRERDDFYPYLTDPGARGLWAVDANGDQAVDVIAAPQIAPLYAYRGTLHHLYQYEYSFYAPDPQRALLREWLRLGTMGRPGDVNGDGYPDVAGTEYCNYSTLYFEADAGDLGCPDGNAVVLPGGPAGLSRRSMVERAVPVGVTLSVGGDLDGDGWDELVFARGRELTLARWRDGALAWMPSRLLPAGETILVTH